MIRLESLASGAVAGVFLSRPERKNAISSETARRLAAAIRLAGADETRRSIILASDGDVFASGGDLTELAQNLDAPDGAEQVLAMGKVMREAISESPIPVIAAVGGGVYGGGCELVLLCDLVVADLRAHFAFRHAKMGLAPAWGGTSRLIDRVGPTEALRLLQTGATLDARTALAKGLVTELAEDGSALDAAVRLSLEIARHPRDAVAAQKRSVQAVLVSRQLQAEEVEANVFREMWGKPAHRKAMEGFLESRQRKIRDTDEERR